MTFDVDNQISAYFHCAKCLKERPENVSPRDWGQLEVGWTEHGLQVWCKRHEINVVHIDFEGQKHPARLDCHEPDIRDEAPKLEAGPAEPLTHSLLHAMWLCRRDQDEEGWTPASRIVMAHVIAKIPVDLMERETNEDGSGRVRLTERGNTVLDYSNQ